MIQRVFKDIAMHEGKKNKVYKCPAGKLTIGYGRNLEDTGISDREAEIMLFLDVYRVLGELDRKVNFWKDQPINVKIVLIQMAFQLGIGGLLGFKKFLNALKNRDYTQAVKEMYDSEWAKQTPNRVKDLVYYIENKPVKEDIGLWNEGIIAVKEVSDAFTGFSVFA